jgi:hypothetical protein
MSHGTTYIITFIAGHDYSAASRIAQTHLALFDGRHPNPNRPMDYTLNEVREYLQAIADSKIYVKEARYPGEPLTYASVCHRMIEPEFVDELLPFFTDLFSSEEENTPSVNSKILFQFEYEHGPLEICLVVYQDNRAVVEAWEESKYKASF